MAWIELHQSLPTHIKTYQLMDELGISQAEAVGHMAMLWLWALDNAPDGYIMRLRPGFIARAAGWSGDPDAFCGALLASGYVDDDGRLHKWDAYTSAYIVARDQAELKREGNRRRQQSYYNRKRGQQPNAQPNASESVSLTRDETLDTEDLTCEPNAEKNVSLTGLYHTIPNHTVPNNTIPTQPGNTTTTACAREGGGGSGMPPTRKQVKEYAETLGLQIDADRFLAINTANDWRDAKGDVIRDWRRWLLGTASNQAKAAKAQEEDDLTQPDPRIAGLEQLKRKYMAEGGVSNE